MAKVKPFQGLRFQPRAGAIADLCCPPYDVVSESERRAFLERNPHNIIRLELPKDGTDPYRAAGDLLARWKAQGVLDTDARSALYIYEEAFAIDGVPYRFKGFFCRVRLEDWDKGVVLPHEQTLSKAKEDRYCLMRATNCNFSGVYSLYLDETQEIQPLLDRLSAREPDVSFVDPQGVSHRLWAATDGAEVREICHLFGPKKLFIADGHHRYETALRFRDAQRAAGVQMPGADDIMMFLVDVQNDGLVVFPTHRVLHDLEGFDARALLDACAPYFEVRRCEDRAQVQQRLSEGYRRSEKCFAFFEGQNWYSLTLRDPASLAQYLPDTHEALRALDVTVLHTLILDRLLGIGEKEMAAGGFLRYTRDAAQAEAMVRQGADCCFLLNPTRIEEICAVASAGEKMPQKSTYFYPKLITGLVMNDLLV